MYKKARKYDQMIRFVSTYPHELLKETHLHLAQMWNDAVRICKLHMRNKLRSKNLARQRHEATMQDSSDIIASARMWEDTGDSNRAIDTYLNVEHQDVEDEDHLSEIWHNAVKLAQHHVQERYSSGTKFVFAWKISLLSTANIISYWCNIKLYNIIYLL